MKIEGRGFRVTDVADAGLHEVLVDDEGTVTFEFADNLVFDMERVKFERFAEAVAAIRERLSASEEVRPVERIALASEVTRWVDEHGYAWVLRQCGEKTRWVLESHDDQPNHDGTCGYDSIEALSLRRSRGPLTLASGDVL